MRLPAAALLVAVSALALPACDVAAMGPESKEHVSETRRLDKGGTFTLENTNGTVTVEAYDGDTVAIEADKVAADSILGDIKIEIKGEGARVDVETHFPRSTFGRSGHVDYRVKVPASAHVELSTTNGRITSAGTRAGLRAETTNGSVDIADSVGSVDASTTNGSIRVAYREAPAGGAQSFTTTNGAISVTLPGDARGEFEARTVNGGISTDFPLEVSGRIGGRHLLGHVGQGGAHYQMTTVNGGIKILKSE